MCVTTRLAALVPRFVPALQFSGPDMDELIVVDTGSPFLTVAGSCTTRWGCFQASLHGEPTLYSETIEVYAAKEGVVKWRRGFISFVNATDGRGNEWGAKAWEKWQNDDWNPSQVPPKVRQLL